MKLGVSAKISIERRKSEGVAIVNNFQTRVTGDSGTLESVTSIRNDIKFLIENP